MRVNFRHRWGPSGHRLKTACSGLPQRVGRHGPRLAGGPQGALSWASCLSVPATKPTFWHTVGAGARAAGGWNQRDRPRHVQGQLSPSGPPGWEVGVLSCSLTVRSSGAGAGVAAAFALTAGREAQATFLFLTWAQALVSLVPVCLKERKTEGRSVTHGQNPREGSALP